MITLSLDPWLSVARAALVAAVLAFTAPPVAFAAPINLDYGVGVQIVERNCALVAPNVSCGVPTTIVANNDRRLANGTLQVGSSISAMGTGVDAPGTALDCSRGVVALAPGLGLPFFSTAARTPVTAPGVSASTAVWAWALQRYDWDGSGPATRTITGTLTFGQTATGAGAGAGFAVKLLSFYGTGAGLQLLDVNQFGGEPCTSALIVDDLGSGCLRDRGTAVGGNPFIDETELDTASFGATQSGLLTFSQTVALDRSRPIYFLFGLLTGARGGVEADASNTLTFAFDSTTGLRAAGALPAASVPEPGTLALLAIALLGVGSTTRRRARERATSLTAG